jgi:hypothetical protein
MDSEKLLGLGFFFTFSEYFVTDEADVQKLNETRKAVFVGCDFFQTGTKQLS